MKIRPVTSLLNPAFQWVPSYATDISKRFATIRAAQQKTEQAADTLSIQQTFSERRRKEIEAKETALRG